MSRDSSGIGGYPSYVLAAFKILLDPPSEAAVRVDPDGERKAEEDRDAPEIKTLHLQWLDTACEDQPVWRDVRMRIDVARRRFRNDAAGIPFLTKGHRGSGAMGVVLVSSPFLLLAAPYIAWRRRRDASREARSGMSRHASALLEKLRGQLDPETEALLVDAMKHLYRRDCFRQRSPTFEEAKAVLSEAHLEILHVPDMGAISPARASYQWTDEEGDTVGEADVYLVPAGTMRVRVLSAWFSGPKTAEFLTCFREKVERHYGDLLENDPTDAA